MRSPCLFVFLLLGFSLKSGSSFQSLGAPRVAVPRFTKLQVSFLEMPEGEVSSSTTRFAWDRPPPKQSLELVGTSETAAPWILSLVELSHWSFAIPGVYGAYEILQHYQSWAQVVEMDSIRLLCLILYLPVMFAAALFPCVSHIYDDWQIAPFREPTVDCSFGNDRLRQICVNLLFQGIGLASVMFSHAILGWEGLPLTLGFALYSILCDKNHLISKYLPMNQDTENIVAPFPVGTLVFLVYSQIAYCWGMWNLVEPVWSSDMILPIAAVSTIVMQTLGGIYEGFVAETSFNQWDHLKAAAFFMISFSSQAYMYHEFGQLFGAM